MKRYLAELSLPARQRIHEAHQSDSSVEMSDNEQTTFRPVHDAVREDEATAEEQKPRTRQTPPRVSNRDSRHQTPFLNEANVRTVPWWFLS